MGSAPSIQEAATSVSHTPWRGVRPLAMQHFYSRSLTGVRPFARPCSIFMCLSGLSLVVSALFCWPCNISIRLSATSVTARLSPRSVTGGIRPFPLFQFIRLPGLSLLASALFRWPCSISIHLSPRSVTASVRPFPSISVLLSPRPVSLFVSQVRHCWCHVGISTHLFPRSVTAGVRPFPSAM